MTAVNAPLGLIAALNACPNLGTHMKEKRLN